MRHLLLSAQASLWSSIGRSRGLQRAEVWSWAFENGRYRTVPFTPPGRRRADEAYAAQLWSTAFIAPEGLVGAQVSARLRRGLGGRNAPFQLAA